VEGTGFRFLCWSEQWHALPPSLPSPLDYFPIPALMDAPHIRNTGRSTVWGSVGRGIGRGLKYHTADGSGRAQVLIIRTIIRY